MSKKVARALEVSEKTDENLVFVQLRLPMAMAEDLREAGSKDRRKLPAEIIHRLRASGTGEINPLAYGWVDPERAKSIGDAVGVLAGRLDEIGPMTGEKHTDGGALIAMLKIALNEILDRLGTSGRPLTHDEKVYASLEAKRFLALMARPEPEANSAGPRPDLEIIGKLGREWRLT